MAPVETLSIETIDMAHNPRQVKLRSSQTQMSVVSQLKNRQTPRSPLPMGFGQSLEKKLDVSTVDKHQLSCSPLGFMISRRRLDNS